MRGDKCKCGGEWRITVHCIGDLNDLLLFSELITKTPDLCQREMKMFTCRKCGVKIVEKSE